MAQQRVGGKKTVSMTVMILALALVVVLTVGATVVVFFVLPQQSAFGLDTDGDGVVDFFDPDDDNDGVPDALDPDPTDPDVPDDDDTDDDTDDDDDDDTDDDDDDEDSIDDGYEDDGSLSPGWLLLRAWLGEHEGFPFGYPELFTDASGDDWIPEAHWDVDFGEGVDCAGPPYEWELRLHKDADGAIFDPHQRWGDLSYNFATDEWQAAPYWLTGTWYSTDNNLIVDEPVDCTGMDGHFVACDFYAWEVTGPCFFDIYMGWILPIGFNIALFAAIAVIIILFSVVIGYVLVKKKNVLKRIRQR